MDVFDGDFRHIAARLVDLRAAAEPTRLLALSVPVPLVAFSRRDELQPGFASAADAAERHGFRAVVRPVGGTFAPMDAGNLVVEEFGFTDAGEFPQPRYERHVRLLVDVFRALGVDARVGEVPGEYCPGAYSVNRDGRVKISGTAQRVAGGAWVVSTTVRVADAAPLRPVIAACGAALGAELDPERAGGIADVVADATVGAVAAAVRERFAADGVHVTA